MMDTATRWKAARLLGQIDASLLAGRDFSLSAPQCGVLQQWLDTLDEQPSIGAIDMVLAREIRKKLQ